MKRISLVTAVLGLALGCGKTDKEKAKDRTDELAAAAAAGSGSGSAVAPACADSVSNLETWLQALAGEGHRTVTTTGVNLVKLDGESPGRLLGHAIAITIKPTEVAVDGTLIADPSKVKGAALIKAFVAGATNAAQMQQATILVDAATPWSTVTGTVAGAAAAGVKRISFVFVAGAPSAADAPPASSIDAEVAARLKALDPAAPPPTFADEVKGKNADLPAKVFKDCPKVIEELLPDLAVLDGDRRDVAIVEEMPKAITECACRVEFAAVQRLMWTWWGRGDGDPLIGVTVDVTTDAKTGTKVTAKPATAWSEAYQQIVAAAGQGKPLALQ